MKVKLLALLCACMLLSGCRVGTTPDVQTEPPATQAPTAEESRLPLLEQGIAMEGWGNLLYIPNEILEGMGQPEIRLLGNGLLLKEYRDQAVVLNHISLEDGALIASGTVTAREGTKLFIGSGEMGLCDRESGRITILDEDLQILRTYPVTAEGEDWYLSPELDMVYIFRSDRGVLVRDLNTGEENWLVDNGFQVTSLGGGNGYVLFEYTDRADQKTYTRCLNLSTASLETLPVDGGISAGTRLGENWLLQNKESYVLVREDTTRSFAWEDADVRLLAPRHHLLAMDSSCRNLTLFDPEGTFLSQCSLPQNSNAMTGDDFVWSGYWEGYFFTDFMDSSCRLMFWDVNAKTEGEDLQMSDPGAAQPSQPLLEPQLYERAAELSKRFGVEIRIAEQCILDYSRYDSYELTDPVFVRSLLDMLEEGLSRYPDGFFSQLCFGSVQSVRIELVGGLRRKDWVEDRPDKVGGFAQNIGSHYLIVLDGFFVNVKTLYHEIAHVIDARLEWDAQIRPDALYSEERWLALQPQGFQYAMSYVDIPEDLDRYSGVGSFLSEYAMTFPTEDRAVLMENAMQGHDWLFEPGSGSAEKLAFYAACIRDCFNTEGWQETMPWEAVLQ